MYCGIGVPIIGGAAIGAHCDTAQGDGAAKVGWHTGAQGAAAATGATYVGAGVGQQTGPRLNQLQGHSGQSRDVLPVQQQPLSMGRAATASKISIFLIVSLSSDSSWGIT